MQQFRGVIGRYHWESQPWWPEPVRAPRGAPNVVLVVLDDVGFAQLGCFGSDIETPSFDALARDGLRYANFHTTALCSPTRSCLLTGRNHHSNGMGRVIELASGFPGYNTQIPRENGFLSEILREHGYATWAVGKWHLTPEDECNLAAPRDRWPLGRGFERFYGFFSGETHQFAPALIRDNHQARQPRRWQDGYHLTEDLVDEAIGLVADLRAVDTEKPFFLYFATGACHSPHQSPAEWVEHYRGRFDEGWDAWREHTLARQVELGVLPAGTELSPRPEWVPAWDALSRDEQRLYARYMEAFAGYLSHTDAQVGRLVDFLRETGDLDDTLLVVLSDNGASSEGGPVGSLNDVRIWNGVAHTVDEALARIDEIGGPRCHNNYPWGWTVAGNTPFRRWKREVHEGGVADPLLVHWPNGIGGRGETRRQYVHAIDFVPTVLDVAGIDAPDTIRGVTQRPIEGVSFAATLRDGDAPDRHETQYYEMFGCRALYHGGWKAVTFVPIQFGDPAIDQAPWELYRVTDDPSECHDLAAEHPDVVQELVERWWVEAAKYQVLPLDNRPISAFVLDRPHAVPARPSYLYRSGSSMVPEAAAVNVKNRTHVLTADVDVPADGRIEGVLLAQGSFLGGWTWYVLDGRLRYAHNLAARELHRVEAADPLPPGRHRLQFRFEKTGEARGVGSLLVDGAVVATGDIPHFTPNRFSLTGAGLTCGYSGELPVVDDYEAPFTFTGVIHGGVRVDVDGPAFVDPQAEAEIAITTQ
ncbi:MAG TPA: arylsulfatase [Acidimicrobiia bacterium]|nr:arylsulfatase [Acidimicrobiia bacterium]